MIARLIVILFLLLPAATYAADSLLYLSKDDVVSIVRKYHPVVRQAELSVKRSEAYVTEARGGFDPKLNAGLDRKSFGGQLYYSYFNPEIKIPTWYGIELKGGLEEVIGSRAISERTPGQTSYAGVNVPLTRGLVFDERRAALRQAQAVLSMTEAERLNVINNTLLDVVSAYWEWVRHYYTYRIYTNAVSLNESRLMMVQREYEQGNRPAIDTVEAMTQLQSYQLLQNDAYLAFQNAGLQLANYLWMENNMPVDWYGNIVPDTLATDMFEDMSIPVMEELIAGAAVNHPKLRMVDYKIEALKIERKLKAVSIMPQLDISANVLNKGYGLPADITTPFLENNHKIGVDFSMPLLFRKERGAYRASAFKVQEAVIERDYTTLQIENKIKSYYNEVVMLNRQIKIYEAAQDNYSRLLRGEITRYEIGESNLFIINSRENKLLDARQKLLELKTKWQKSYAGLLWAAGIM